MAIDTREKRSSAVHVMLPWRGMLPLPDGTISDADRQHVALLYSGIAVSAAVIIFGPFHAEAMQVFLAGMQAGEVWGFERHELEAMLRRHRFRVVKYERFSWGLNELYVCQRLAMLGDRD